MVFIVPGATYRPVKAVGDGILNPTMGLILHTQQGNNSPFGWFNDPTHEASSTWWVSKTGLIEQYIDPDAQHAWAQAAGNNSFHSVEAEGWVTEPLTQAQITALTAIYLAGYRRWGWPLKLSEAPTDKGFGWHGEGGLAWGGHLGCPGDIRKAQRSIVLGRVQTALHPVELPVVPKRIPLIVDGTFGPKTVSALRARLNAGPGGWDATAKKDLQTYLKVHADGVIGPITITAMQKHLGVPADGSWGAVTTTALQKALNAGTF